jgi:very-short-patch-repair endonuclease/transcription elongation GreA/GreB family factor
MCGNAATFQGQERDIMFLSMVACPATARSQTTRTSEQRFNVAMSRARDRLHLVRSVKASDLGDRDLKLAIIEHFARPMGETPATQPTEVLEICDSGFERDVGGRLLKLGYRVKAQVPVAGFRIDFVIEGAGDKRLAIELDGDKYHGPDRWIEDLRRQRTLERMGWVFWRCWGSHWLADPEGCLGDLLATLQHLGIEPVSGEFSAIAWTRHITVGEDDSGAGENPAEEAPTQEAGNNAETPEGGTPAERAASGAGSEEDTTVAPGDTVVIRFADNNQLRRFRISAEQHAPDDGVVGLAQPLAQALLGSSVDEEVEFTVGGQARVAVVERILRAA